MLLGHLGLRKTQSHIWAKNKTEKDIALVTLPDVTASSSAPVEKDLPWETKEAEFVVQREKREKNREQRKGKTSYART